MSHERRASWTVALMLALGIGATGCATSPPPVVSVDEAPLSGRLALSVAATASGAARNASLHFEWSGNAQQGKLDLSTPLGTRLAEARWQPGRAELRSPDGLREFADLDSLTEAMLGERLPMQALADWLRGRPWSGATFEPLGTGPAGPGRFRQAGWTVDLSEHAEGRIEARRTEPAPAVQLRLRLDPPLP